MAKTTKKPKYPALEFQTREVTSGINGTTEILMNGKRYYVLNSFLIGSGVPRPYWNPETSQWNCTRARDFGGCGKDAMKPEKNVPYGTWLREVQAKEV